MSATVTAGWGGRTVPVSTDPAPPLVEGRHAFVVLAVFDVRRPGRPDILLDAENLRSVAAPLCWHCRTTTDDGTPCPGTPT